MTNKKFSEKAQLFYRGLVLPTNLPKGIEAINPYQYKTVKKGIGLFLNLYFADNHKRVLVMGINPGRFGSGITGVPFTDPVALQVDCGIENDFIKKRELSSEFIYRFINKWGGTKKFYRDFFLTAVSPIGFTQNGLNYNYYDDKKLNIIIKPFILRTLKKQINFGVRDICILLGTGKNQKAFTEINKELGLFKKVYAVEHPRYVMQYKRKYLNDYLDKYEKVFTQALAD